MTALEPPDHPRLGQRLLLWLLIVLVAGGTGLFWSGQRRARTVDATVRLSLTGEVDTAGTVHVTEELVVQSSGSDSVQRILVVPGGVRWAGVTDATGAARHHTTLPLAEGLQVTVPLEDEPSVLQLHYDLIGVAQAGMDAAELAWPVLDDRNPLALSGLEVDVSWLAPSAPAVVDVEAPGAMTTVVPRDGGLRVQAGALPAHHLVEVHAALPRDAVTEGMVQDRSVLADMEAPDGDRGSGGGGPWWAPVAAVLVFLGVWAAVHRTHGREPDAGPPGIVQDAPGASSPAEVAWLLRRGAVRQEDVVTTLVDLAHRGVLTVRGTTWTLAAGTDRTGALRPHERILLDWLFAQQTQVTVAERTAAITQDPVAWRETWRAFQSAVEAEGRHSGMVERTVDAESILGGGVAATSMVVLGVAGTALGQPAWLLCVAVGALAIVGVDTFARRSPEGAVMAARWQAFAAHLRASPQAVAGHRALALALGVPAATTPLEAGVDRAVQGFEDAYVTTTSYLAGPTRRRVGRRRGGVRT